MTSSLFLASAEARSGKSAVALGMIDQLVRRGGRVGVFRPLVQTIGQDRLLDLLAPRTGSPIDLDAACGVTYEQFHADSEAAVARTVQRYHAYAEDHDVVLIVGSDYTDVPSPTEFSVNAVVAANLGAPMVLIVAATDRSPGDVAVSAGLAVHEAQLRHAKVRAVIANRDEPGQLDDTREALTRLFSTGDIATYALPADPVLSAPTVRDLMTACGGSLLLGEEELLDREGMQLIVAAMTFPNVLDRLTEGCVLICPADRAEVLLTAVLAHRSSTFPNLAGVILNGGFPLTEQIARLVDGLDLTLPLITAGGGTMHTAMACHAAKAEITPRSERKIAVAQRIVDEHIQVADLLPDPHVKDRPGVVTPLMFEHRITQQARAAQAHIVLPEGMEERILRASDALLSQGVARLTLLGPPDQVRAKAAALGVWLNGTEVIDPATDPRREEFATTYATLRAHKGVTLDQAHDTVIDPAYFGTLMVLAGQADGMVSGCITTTAHTVRPALEVIRTLDGVSVVSSVFFMCLADRVLVYGDCAINPDPTAEQLADIAISSAATAEQFGVEPRVAMLSYSTGGSGAGADVEKVRAATELVRCQAPGLMVGGPIQYDAAVDPAVAATKLEGSAVGGRATVLIFPDLNTGNNTYKAVQRSAAAVAVGPVLQGLRRPVNDLSRGATVRDIVNTVAITAVQAGTRREQA